jgi:peptidoglycan/LPS O-acetylase OafA/YrhL
VEGLFLREPSKVAMGDEPEWRWLTLGGLICVLQSFVHLDIPGPWNSSSFSQGSIALLGLGLLYLAWFRWTFKVKGVAPVISRWKDPVNSSKKVTGIGVILLILAFVTGRVEVFPEPTGLLLSLVGMLVLLCGLYVWAVVDGPLQEEE